jgi:hypothetical protein
VGQVCDQVLEAKRVKARVSRSFLMAIPLSPSQ